MRIQVALPCVLREVNLDAQVRQHVHCVPIFVNRQTKQVAPNFLLSIQATLHRVLRRLYILSNPLD